MYDVAPRTTIFRSTTGVNVGPSTYEVCDPKDQKRNWAPFLSSVINAPSFVSKFNTEAIYDVRGSRNKIIGGASLQSKAPRFVYRADTGPGPTKYNAKPISCKKKKLILDPTKPKLYACAVPYSMSVIAPSIPTKRDENGYELDEEGNLLKVPRDVPKSIDSEIKSQFSDRRGWRWSCRTSRRFDKNAFETCGPGPAAYQTKLPKCRRIQEDEEYREMARLFTFLPRYVEGEELKATKESRPGPGDYDIVKDNWTKKELESINPLPFIRGSPRFKTAISDNPGPTHYNICNCSKDKKYFSYRCAPFGNVAPRFKRGNAERTPGPGDYEIKGALREKIEKKKNPHALCDPPFNMTSLREMNLVHRDAPFMPSSADYPEDTEADEEADKIPISSSVFMNNVCRFFSPTDTKHYTEPAKYNIVESFKKSKARISFSVAEVAFNTSGPRSVIPETKFGVPCPTMYSNKKEIGCKGYTFSRSPRYTCIEETPGPGAYNIHPRVEMSTYKSVDTHNLHLKENVLRKKLRVAPRDTRKRWLMTMKKKKLLKWFDVELDYEERMILLIQKLFDKPI